MLSLIPMPTLFKTKHNMSKLDPNIIN